MDTNIAAWMIAGGPHIEIHADAREREQLHAFRESQRAEQMDQPSLVARIRSFVKPAAAEPEFVCCPA